MKLELATKEQLLAQQPLESPAITTEEETSAHLIDHANDIFKRLQQLDTTDDIKHSIQNLGEDLLVDMGQNMAMLKAPMHTLEANVEDHKGFANDLSALLNRIDHIHPRCLDPAHGAVRTILATLPGIATPMMRWLTKCRSASAEIKAITQRIHDARTKMERDSTSLRDDQRRIREQGFKLKEYIALTKLLAAHSHKAVVAKKCEHNIFTKEELQGLLGQRLAYLEREFALNRQCVLDCELLIRNNRELIIGVDHALSVTVAAAAQTAELQGQIQGKLQSKHGSDERPLSITVHKLAALSQTFTQVQAALESLEAFRRSALSQMTRAIFDADALQLKNQGEQMNVDRAEIGKISTIFDIKIKDG